MDEQFTGQVSPAGTGRTWEEKLKAILGVGDDGMISAEAANVLHTVALLSGKIDQARQKGELRKLLLGRGEYRQKHGFLQSTNRALRALCLAVALNEYGARNPDFQPELCQAMTQVLQSGRRKGMVAAMAVVQQWIIQKQGNAAMDFVDEPLRSLTVKYLKKQKRITWLLVLAAVIVADAIPMFISFRGNMDAFLPFFPLCGFLAIYALLTLVSVIPQRQSIKILESDSGDGK